MKTRIGKAKGVLKVKAVKSTGINTLDKSVLNGNISEKAKLFQEYIDLKKIEKDTEKRLDDIKAKFTADKMDGFEHNGKTLKLTEKKRETYDSKVLDYLKYKNVLEKCIIPDKKKIDALVKVEILDEKELKEFKQSSTSYAWTVKALK